MSFEDRVVGTLEDAGLPVVRIGGLAYQVLSDPEYGMATGDLDLAITLPRHEDIEARWDQTIAALAAIGLRTNPTLWTRPRMAGFAGGPYIVDLFINGVYDFDHRPDGTGCTIHVDDESGPDLSVESLILCKLIADRPNDREHIAGLLLSDTGLDLDLLREKAARQIECPGPDAGRRRIARCLGRMAAEYAPGSGFLPVIATLLDRQEELVEHIEELRRLLA